MTALSAGRKVPFKAPPSHVEVALKASQTLYHGALVCLDSTGYGVPGATGLGLRKIGVYEGDNIVSAGTNGATKVRVRRGVFPFANSAGADALTQADVENVVYIVDDQTVAKRQANDTGSTQQVATGTPTAVNSTLYQVRLDVDKTGTGAWKSYVLGYVSDASATAQEICDGLRTDLALIDDLSGVVAGSGSTTLVLTGGHGVLFEAANIGVGVIAFAATTAGVYVRRSPGGVLVGVESSLVWVDTAR